jgi:hypothetical protein
MTSITLCILGYILLIANINPEASFAGCFIVAIGLYTAAGTPFSWGPVNNPRYGKRAIASGIQLTIGNASGVAAPFCSPRVTRLGLFLAMQVSCC